MPILTEQERIGTVVAEKYRIERILGRGGMGVVFAGVHTWTGRDVALKILKPDYAGDPVVVRRFLQEARTAATLSHPNVVDVLDMGVDVEGTVYLVLELLRGESLTDRIAHRGRLPVTEALEQLLPVMDALAEAHVRGIVHRDVKPDNIYLSVDATGVGVPKLLDFGIAKVVDDASGRGAATRTGTVIGTAAYMAPEQASARADVGPAVDVWAMGVVLFECLSGTLPFVADSTAGMLLAIVNTRAPSFATAVPSLPGPLAAALDRSLVPDRGERYPDMVAFLEGITAAARACGLEQTVRAVRRIERPLDIVVTRETTERIGIAPTSAATTAGREKVDDGATRRADTFSPTVAATPSSRRRRGLVALGGVALLAVVGIVAALVHGNDGPTHGRTATPVTARHVGAGNRSRASRVATMPVPEHAHEVTAQPAQTLVAAGTPPADVLPDGGTVALGGPRHGRPSHAHHATSEGASGVSSGHAATPLAGANGAPILE